MLMLGRGLRALDNPPTRITDGKLDVDIAEIVRISLSRPARSFPSTGGERSPTKTKTAARGARTPPGSTSSVGASSTFRAPT